MCFLLKNKFWSFCKGGAILIYRGAEPVAESIQNRKSSMALFSSLSAQLKI